MDSIQLICAVGTHFEGPVAYQVLALADNVKLGAGTEHKQAAFLSGVQ